MLAVGGMWNLMYFKNFQRYFQYANDTFTSAAAKAELKIVMTNLYNTSEHFGQTINI